jgi:hypothetical protein
MSTNPDSLTEKASGMLYASTSVKRGLRDSRPTRSPDLPAPACATRRFVTAEHRLEEWDRRLVIRILLGGK